MKDLQNNTDESQDSKITSTQNQDSGNSENTDKQDQESLLVKYITPKNAAKAEMEEELDRLGDEIVLADKEITSLKKHSKSSGKLGKSKLSRSQAAKNRNKVLQLEKIKRELQNRFSILDNKLYTVYKTEEKSNARKGIRKAAKKDDYHKRNSESIKTNLSKYVTGFEKGVAPILKADFAELKAENGDAFLMKKLLKAPNNLHTKVVANQTYRKEYLGHFKLKLGISNRAKK